MKIKLREKGTDTVTEHWPVDAAEILARGEHERVAMAEPALAAATPITAPAIGDLVSRVTELNSKTAAQLAELAGRMGLDAPEGAVKKDFLNLILAAEFSAAPGDEEDWDAPRGPALVPSASALAAVALPAVPGQPGPTSDQGGSAPPA